jgi:hypothetical protein
LIFLPTFSNILSLPTTVQQQLKILKSDRRSWMTWPYVLIPSVSASGIRGNEIWTYNKCVRASKLEDDIWDCNIECSGSTSVKTSCHAKLPLRHWRMVLDYEDLYETSRSHVWCYLISNRKETEVVPTQSDRRFYHFLPLRILGKKVTERIYYLVQRKNTQFYKFYISPFFFGFK